MAANPLRRPLDTHQTRVIQVLHDALARTGAWPVGGYVRDVLAAEGLDMDAIARTMGTGWQYAPITWGHFGGAIQQIDPVAATIAGLQHLPAAAPLVDDVLVVISGLADAYHDLPLDPQGQRELRVTWTDIARVLEAHRPGQLPVAVVEQTVAVFIHEPPGWGATALGAGTAGQTWTASWTIGRFGNLADAGDYLDRVQAVYNPNVHTPEPVAALAHASRPSGGAGVTPGEARRLTNGYIGVDGGYLGDFNRGELQTFYDQHRLDYDIDDHEGTTRQRFIDILLAAPTREQATILRGVLDRFPVGGNNAPEGRTEAARQALWQLISRCEGHAVDLAPPSDASEAVVLALADAQTLLGTAGAPNALDRVHTALHGYLRETCERAQISAGSDSSIGALWSLLRRQHQKLVPTGPRAEDIDKIQKAMATVTDVLMPLRNRATLAHPNPELLGEPEAMLAINAARSVFVYVEAKLREPSIADPSSCTS